MATIYNWKRRLSVASPEGQADVANEQQLVRVRVASEAPVTVQTDGFELSFVGQQIFLILGPTDMRKSFNG